MRQSQNRMNFMIYLRMYNLLHFAYEILFTNRKKNSLLVSNGRSTKYKRFSQYLTDNVSIFAFMNCFKGFYCQYFCAIYQNTVYLHLLRNCFDTIYEIKHNKHILSIYFINLRVHLIIYRWIMLKEYMHFTCTTLNSDDRFCQKWYFLYLHVHYL